MRVSSDGSLSLSLSLILKNDFSPFTGLEYVTSTDWLRDKYGVTRYSTKTRVKASIAESSLKSVLSQVYRKNVY